jgi:hypothetical protein
MATILPQRKGTNADYIEDIRLAVVEKKNVSLSALHIQYENSSRRLEDDIEVSVSNETSKRNSEFLTFDATSDFSHICISCKITQKVLQA